MNPIKRLGLIIAVALTVDAAINASAFPRTRIKGGCS